VLSGPDVGKSFEVEPGDTLGRGHDCIITLRHASVSRRHAHLEREGDTWYVVDDGSRNGVTVGGQRRERSLLADQTEFSLGELLLRFRLEEPAPPVRPEPPEFPAPRASAFEDEIVLEGPTEIELDREPESPFEAIRRTTFAPRAPPPAAPSPSADTGFGPALDNAPSGRRAGPGDRILQYHKVASRGFSSTDLTQYPLWARLGFYLLALLLAAALFYLAFHGARFVRRQVGGGG
jgi:hypothetical protein